MITKFYTERELNASKDTSRVQDFFILTTLAATLEKVSGLCDTGHVE